MKNDLLKSATEQLLQKRFSNNKNEMLNALYGLEVYSGVKYWEYINVDALIGLQHPKTSKPDEMIFIVYHQICELYFKLIIHEIDLIQKSYSENKNTIDSDLWIKHIGRIQRYYNLLLNSFEQVLSVNNLDTEEFFQFRMALIPASGFQTAQFRKIEIMLTSLDNLTFEQNILDELNIELTNTELKDVYERIYWKLGARDSETKQKSQLLIDFENKYDSEFKYLSDTQKDLNLGTIINSNSNINTDLKDSLLQLDITIVNWKAKHYEILGPHFVQFNRLSEKYNWHIDPTKGTGNTNVREFLTASMKLNYFKL